MLGKAASPPVWACPLGTGQCQTNCCITHHNGWIRSVAGLQLESQHASRYSRMQVGASPTAIASQYVAGTKQRQARSQASTRCSVQPCRQGPLVDSGIPCSCSLRLPTDDTHYWARRQLTTADRPGHLSFFQVLSNMWDPDAAEGSRAAPLQTLVLKSRCAG